MRRRAGAALAIAGVASFVTAWVVLSAIRKNYSPVNDAISQLAELGAPHRGLMTAGIVAFGAGAVAFAPSLGGRAGAALAVAGLGSFGVASFPCTEGCPGAGEFTDTAHGVAAAVHYVAFAVTPFLVGRDRRSAAITALAGLALAIHATGLGPSGLFQRLGLTTLDVWLVATAFRHLIDEAATSAPEERAV